MARRIYDHAELADLLYDELIRHPDGMTMERICTRLGIPWWQASKVISKLRIDLADARHGTVPVIRKNMTWRYKLVGTFDETRDWLVGRERQAATKLNTDIASLRALVALHDGRTSDGKRVRRLLRYTEAVQAELVDFLDEIENHR